MGIGEFFVRLASAIKPVIMTTTIVFGITLVVVSIIFALTMGTWVNKKGFTWFGLFFGLKKWSRVQLSAVWLLFLFYLCFLFPNNRLGSVQYILIAILMLISAVDIYNPKTILSRLLFYFFQLVGLFCANTVWSYMQDTDYENKLWLIAYIIMAIFLALFDFYLMLTGLDVVSKGRSISFDQK